MTQNTKATIPLSFLRKLHGIQSNFMIKVQIDPNLVQARLMHLNLCIEEDYVHDSNMRSWRIDYLLVFVVDDYRSDARRGIRSVSIGENVIIEINDTGFFGFGGEVNIKLDAESSEYFTRVYNHIANYYDKHITKKELLRLNEWPAHHRSELLCGPEFSAPASESAPGPSLELPPEIWRGEVLKYLGDWTPDIYKPRIEAIFRSNSRTSKKIEILIEEHTQKRTWAGKFTCDDYRLNKGPNNKRIILGTWDYIDDKLLFLDEISSSILEDKLERLSRHG